MARGIVADTSRRMRYPATSNGLRKKQAARAFVARREWESPAKAASPNCSVRMKPNESNARFRPAADPCTLRLIDARPSQAPYLPCLSIRLPPQELPAPAEQV